MTTVAYLDTSALAKLVRDEAETEALRHWLRETSAHEFASSALATVELTRAARRSNGQDVAVAVARRVLAGVALVGVTPAILQRAADLEPPGLRSLDAIHVATALELGRGLRALVSYDRRMLGAARSLGLPVVAPA